jgi:hypothetical protein
MADANDPVVTRSMFDEALHESSKSIIDEVAGIINTFAARMDERFNKVEADIADLNSKYGRLVTTLDAFLKPSR